MPFHVKMTRSLFHCVTCRVLQCSCSFVCLWGTAFGAAVGMHDQCCPKSHQKFIFWLKRQNSQSTWSGPWRVSLQHNIRLPEARHTMWLCLQGQQQSHLLGPVQVAESVCVTGLWTVNSNYIQISVTRVTTRAQRQMVKSKPIPYTSRPITLADGGRPWHIVGSCVKPNSAESLNRGCRLYCR